MRLTPRDIRLLRDMALSHVLSRDQVISLQYFGSVTRANTRLRELAALGLVRVLTTPFFSQQLYMVTNRAGAAVGERVSCLLRGRSGSPRFLQHALCVTNARITLLERGATGWRFEQQAERTFRFGATQFEVRPDGLALLPDAAIAVEADLGHVAPAKFREKVRAYEAFARSGECDLAWGRPSFRLLVITTGRRRSATLTKILGEHPAIDFLCQPHDQIGVKWAGGWS